MSSRPASPAASRRLRPGKTCPDLPGPAQQYRARLAGDDCSAARTVGPACRCPGTSPVGHGRYALRRQPAYCTVNWAAGMIRKGEISRHLVVSPKPRRRLHGWRKFVKWRRMSRKGWRAFQTAKCSGTVARPGSALAVAIRAVTWSCEENAATAKLPWSESAGIVVVAALARQAAQELAREPARRKAGERGPWSPGGPYKRS
jgi:hypothetical protein